MPVEKTAENNDRPKTGTVEVYVPHEALQGEEVPGFALWKGQSFQRVEVELPAGLRLKELYNVSEHDWKQEGNRLLVTSLEVDGYLGMLFESFRLDRIREKTHLTFRFYQSETDIIEEQTPIELYRPLLEPPKDSPVIKLDPMKLSIAAPIAILKKGDGTVYVQLNSKEDSEVTVKEPKQLVLFKKEFNKFILEAFSNLAEKFPDHRALLMNTTKYITTDPEFADPDWMKGFKEQVESLRQVMLSNEELRDGTAEALSNAFLKSLQYLNVFEQLKDYLLSIAEKKVLIENPIDVISLRKGKNQCKLSLEYTDLTYEHFPPLEIEVTIMSETSGEFPIYKLFSWN